MKDILKVTYDEGSIAGVELAAETVEELYALAVGLNSLFHNYTHVSMAFMDVAQQIHEAGGMDKFCETTSVPDFNDLLKKKK